MSMDRAYDDGKLIKELWDEIAPQCGEEWRATQEKIRAELTDEQKVQFVEFMKNPRKKLPSTNAPPKEASAPATNAPMVAPVAPATNAPATAQ